MNTLGLNQGLLNGNSAAKWVVAASVFAVAGVTSASTAQRIFNGQVNASVTATVTLSSSNEVAGRCENYTAITSSVSPHTIFNCSILAIGASTGNAAVLRNVYAASSADGICYGEALAADQLGEVSSTSSASFAVIPHIVFPGKINQIGSGSLFVDSFVDRRTTVHNTAYSDGFIEPSIQLNGESFTRLIGSVFKNALSSGAVRNDYTAIIATIGVFQFGNSSGIANPYVNYFGASLRTANSESSVSSTKIIAGSFISDGVSTEEANAVLIKNSTFIGFAQAGYGLGKPVVTYQGKVNNQFGTLNTVVITPTRLTNAYSIGISNVVSSITFANQLYAESIGVTESNCAVYGYVNYFALSNSDTSSYLEVQGITTKTAYVVGLSNLTSTVIGFSNIDRQASESRTCFVLPEPRNMIAPSEDRVMIVRS